MAWQDPGEPLTGIGFVGLPTNHDTQAGGFSERPMPLPQDFRSYQRPPPENPSFVRAYSVDPTHLYPSSQARAPFLMHPPLAGIPPVPGTMLTSQFSYTSTTPPSQEEWTVRDTPDASARPYSTSLVQSSRSTASMMGNSTIGNPTIPEHSPDYNRPFHSTFTHYGTVAMQRQEAQLATPAPFSTSSGIVHPDPFNAEVQLARDRAMRIIQQFRESDPNRVDSEMAQKRKASLEQLEKRKRLAMIRNLEYVAKAEDERLKEKLLQVHQAQEYHSKLEAHHQQSLQLRLQHLGKQTQTIPITTTTPATTPLLSTQAGIGTQQRQRVEEKRRKTHLAATTLSTETVAIYVSQLPTDGSVNEALLRTLFGSLGYSLRKVHIYTNKETGELKGDALIVYELPSGEDRNSLTSTVCSQVRTFQSSR